ncbi:2-amino-4-hydroxy-6-hydroxymethyldihydropteridine diphosphokinase [Acetobacteraceae bacterium]|nr:2-amino-4-hydroxy-6-hydroxymethyldihydropteridine diphosphokinase [Acetobacteraceae bacterium]
MISPPLIHVQIQDLKIMACHGVLAHEKTIPQPFLISLDLSVTPPEWLGMTAQDDLSQTICYANLCQFVENFVQKNCFNLIETLSKKLGSALLEAFDNLNQVKILIKKPEAPLPSHFGENSLQKQVQISHIATKIYPVGIALGSNLGEREAFLEAAINSLNLLDEFEVLKTSPVLETEPWGKTDQGKFLNQCLTGQTTLDPFALLRALKKLEREIGRVPSKKWGPRHIDIDLIFYSHFKIKSTALNLPHVEAALREFVLKPFAEIDPNLKIGENTVKKLLGHLKT